MRLPAVWLTLATLGLSSTALAHGREAPRYLRTALEDDAAVALTVREPRRIRTTLDDSSHAAFPLDSEGRLIRVTLDDGVVRYGRLGLTPSHARRVRTALD